MNEHPLIDVLLQIGHGSTDRAVLAQLLEVLIETDQGGDDLLTTHLQAAAYRLGRMTATND